MRVLEFGSRMIGYTVPAVLFVILSVFRGMALPSASTPYVINCRVFEPGAAGFGSKGCLPSSGCPPPAPVGIKGSVAARANGANREAALRTAAASKINRLVTIAGYLRRRESLRGICKEQMGSGEKKWRTIGLSLS